MNEPYWVERQEPGGPTNGGRIVVPFATDDEMRAILKRVTAERGEPVAWRWRYIYRGEPSGWRIRQTPMEGYAETAELAALDLEG